jgi:hypothetical protein
MSLTELSLAGNNLILSGEEEMVGDIPAGDGININIFYSVLAFLAEEARHQYR